MFSKMLDKCGRVAVGSKCVFVFVKPYCEVLIHLSFLTVGACEFL